jgi:hypothetical protein
MEVSSEFDVYGGYFAHAMRGLESGASGGLHRVQFSTVFQF